MSKARAIVDDGFLIGLVFALFLAGKILPFLVVVGILPIIIFWAKEDYLDDEGTKKRLLVPAGLFFLYSVTLLYFYPGLSPDVKRPINPGLELYIVGFSMLLVGYFRSLQIKNLLERFQQVVPLALLTAFLVLSAYMFAGLDGCRVRVAAPWPFVPALIFTTLTFLLLVGWEKQTRFQRLIRLLIVSLSIVVVLAYTGSRGVAAGELLLFAALGVLRLWRRFRSGLPTLVQIGAAVGIGLALSLLTGVVTGCGNFDRWRAISEVQSKDQSQTSIAVPLESVSDIISQPLQSDTALTATAASDRPFSSDEAISIRVSMWRVSLDAIKQAPFFGHGALSLKPIIQDKFGYEHNHNQYLAWLVTGGVFYLAVGLIFLSTPFFISKGLVPSDRAIIILAVTVLWGGAMMFDAFFSLKFYLHYYCLLIGFIFALAKSAAPTNSS